MIVETASLAAIEPPYPHYKHHLQVSASTLLLEPHAAAPTPHAARPAQHLALDVCPRHSQSPHEQLAAPCLGGLHLAAADL